MFERVGLERTRCAFCGRYELVVLLPPKPARSYWDAPKDEEPVPICRGCILATGKWAPRLRILNERPAPAAPSRPAKPAKRKARKGKKAKDELKPALEPDL